jgi:sugar/nucleoside kinase (ribokinase family)
VDDILYVRAYPGADAKVEVRRRERHCGGLCATALVAAARLGASCAYAGIIGLDEGSRFVLESFQREGVDVRHVLRREDAGPVRSIILVGEAQRTRNIFYDTTLVRGADPKRPPKELILGARVLLVDRFGIAGMIRAARLARAAGIPVVADFESSGHPRFRELLGLVDHVIVSREFACSLTGKREAREAVMALWHARRRVVVLTAGAEGCWFLESGGRAPQHLPAFPVKAVDTTGCGDVFHGAYAAMLARGLVLGERLRLASAAAALKALRHGGQSGAPSLEEVQDFLRQHGSRTRARS